MVLRGTEAPRVSVPQRTKKGNSVALVAAPHSVRTARTRTHTNEITPARGWGALGEIFWGSLGKCPAARDSISLNGVRAKYPVEFHHPRAAIRNLRCFGTSFAYNFLLKLHLAFCADRLRSRFQRPRAQERGYARERAGPPHTTRPTMPAGGSGMR